MTLHVKWEQGDEGLGHVRYAVEMEQDMTGQRIKASALLPVYSLYDAKEAVWRELIRKGLQEGML